MSNCIWYRLWHKRLTGEISSQELDRLTSARPLATDYVCYTEQLELNLNDKRN